MGYLTPGDYKKSIQADNLNQVIGFDAFILADAEALAVEDARSGLVQKYEVDQEFTETLAWNKADTYKGLERVYLTAPTYSSTSLYVTGDYATYQPSPSSQARNVYRATVDIAVAEPFNPAHWQLIAQEYAIYSPVLPAPVFDINRVYKTGDVVFWHDKVYTCVQSTHTLSAEDVLQYFRYENVPPRNVIPDDPINGVYFWGNGVAFSIAPGIEITNTTKWLPGDNRCKQVVYIVVCLTLYYIHTRIAPRNIPELRKAEADAAEARLIEFAEGKKTPTLPKKQPRQGARVRYGGNVKNNNTY